MNMYKALGRSVDTNVILGRTLIGPPSSTIRCTVIDSKGRASVASKEFDRLELQLKHGLLPRDLRKVDVSRQNIVPTILVRKNAILVHLLHIRALIKADTVLLFNLYGDEDTEALSAFLYDLHNRLQSTSSKTPYELRALEAILVSVENALDVELAEQTHLVESLLEALERSIEREQLRHLLVQSKTLSSFLQKVKVTRDTLVELVDNPEDLKSLHLSAIEEQDEVDTDDAEIMLDSYIKHLDEIVQSTETLADNIDSTEEIINIVLDSNRNQLMTLELKFQIGMLGIGAGSLIAAAYGMNLKNYIEDSQFGFLAVVAVLGITTIAVIKHFLRRLYRLQRVQMDRSQRFRR